MTTKTMTIDLTPTWSGLLPALLLAYTNGTPEGKRMARGELLRMAEAADKYNELCAQQKEDA